MHIGKIDKDECLVIPLRLLTNLNIIEFVFKLVLVFFTYNIQSISSSQISPFVNLRFLTKLDTATKQEAFRQAINNILPNINHDNGRHWVSIYIAYTYAIGKRVLLEDYYLFFSDIEALFPKLLEKINPNETGSNRYSRYTDLLSQECKLWFIDNGRLPELNEWTSSKYVYQVKKEWRSTVHELTNILINAFKKIF